MICTFIVHVCVCCGENFIVVEKIGDGGGYFQKKFSQGGILAITPLHTSAHKSARTVN